MYRFLLVYIFSFVSVLDRNIPQSPFNWRFENLRFYNTEDLLFFYKIGNNNVSTIDKLHRDNKKNFIHLSTLSYGECMRTRLWFFVVSYTLIFGHIINHFHSGGLLKCMGMLYIWWCSAVTSRTLWRWKKLFFTAVYHFDDFVIDFISTQDLLKCQLFLWFCCFIHFFIVGN